MIIDWIVQALVAFISVPLGLIPPSVLPLPDLTSFAALAWSMNRWLPIGEILTIGLIYLSALPVFVGIRAVEWAYKRIPFNG